MKQIVLERRIKTSESKFNEAFIRLSEHYGFTVKLCWPYRPQTKGKVERNIGYVRSNFFNGRVFESLQDMNKQCSKWLIDANGKVNATTGKMPSDSVKDEILITMNGIPGFTYSITNTRKISRECDVNYNSNRYSVPWKYAGRNCVISEENGKIRICIASEVIEHEMLSGSCGISRKKEHFDGLLKVIRDQNAKIYAVEVQKGDLKDFEVL